MPPSRIPEAQVQAILAELRQSGAYSEAGADMTVHAPAARPKHTVGMVAAVVASALILGLAFSPLSDLVWSQPEAPPKPAPAPTAPTPIPVQAAAPTVPVAAATVPVRRATVINTAPTRPKSRCLAGGRCGRADVAAAERRLRVAYSSAEKAGVSRADLASAKTRWDAQRRRYAKSPRTSVRALRAVAADLNRKAASARAD